MQRSTHRFFTLFILLMSVPLFSQDWPQSFRSVGTVVPRHAREIDSSPWAVQFNMIPPHIEYPAEKIDMDSLRLPLQVKLDKAAEAGIKWARVSINWSSIEDRDGNYHWQILDETLDGLLERGIEPYVCIHGGHPVHTDLLPPTSSKAGMEAWTDYVRGMVTRYKDRISFWEFWNEPNYPSFWKPKPDAFEYVRLCKTGSRLIRSIDPDAILIAGSMARLDYPYAEKMFAFGVAPYIDIITFHPYNIFPEGSVNKMSYPVQTPEFYRPSSHQISTLAQMVQSHEQGIELWQGECGYPSTQYSHGWTGTGPWGENIQAKWLLRRMLVDVSQNLRVSCYFSMSEFSLGSGDRLNTKGLLRYGSWQPKPAYRAFQNLASIIHRDIKSVEIGATFQIRDQGIFYRARSDKLFYTTLKPATGRPIFAYWIPWRPQELVDPGSVDIVLKSHHWQEPVLIDPMDGKVYALAIKKSEPVLDGLPVADYPFFIVEKSEINLSH
ncbi:cellulase family glycosylhydrolase [candidate division KSB1 bacterium]|nr:cellulase family glycosylhydrolase [candidate division KSB1 bacterium]